MSTRQSICSSIVLCVALMIGSDALAQTVALVGPDGAQPDISPDGRYVVFDSANSNLVPGDTNSEVDVFLHDRQTGTFERVSVGPSGSQANGSSGDASISDDGRYVAFWSIADNFIPNDNNDVNDIFVHDRQTGATTCVSVDSQGVQGNDESVYPAISADGRYVAFLSLATNLVGGDTNGVYDIFLHDRQTAMTQRVSISSAGIQGNAVSGHPLGGHGPSISGDGRYVTFHSNATNLVPGDTNGGTDIFVHDHQTGTTERASVDSLGGQSNGSSGSPSISGSGRFVVFYSEASNLVTGDMNNADDIFVHDRQAGATKLASIDTSGYQSNGSSYDPDISQDGYHVGFQSYATNLVFGDTNGEYDIFVHDCQSGVTRRVWRRQGRASSSPCGDR